MKLFNRTFADLFTAAAVNSQLVKGKPFTYEIQSLCGDYLCTITLDKSVSFSVCTAYIELTKNGSVCDTVDGRPCASVADLKDFLRTLFDAWNEENPQLVSTGESQDYEVIYNIRESTESQSESLRSIKEIENDKGKKNANTDVFVKYGYTKEKYNKYTIIRDRNGKEITRVSGGLRSRLDVDLLITCALLDGRNFDKQPCKAYKQFEVLSVNSKFQLVFLGTAFNAIIDCVKSSVPGSYDCVINGEPKTLEFNKGWTSASVRTDYDFNTEDLTVEKIHECLDCGFNGIQYISKSSKDKFLNIGIKVEHGRYRLTLDCYDSGKLIKSDSVVTMWDSGVVGRAKQFILDL